MGALIRDVLPLMIPIVALMIPVIALLTKHQQQMAKTLAESRGHQGDFQIEALRREVAELKSLVHQQAIAIDNLVSVQSRQIPDLRERVGS